MLCKPRQIEIPRSVPGSVRKDGNAQSTCSLWMDRRNAEFYERDGTHDEFILLMSHYRSGGFPKRTQALRHRGKERTGIEQVCSVHVRVFRLIGASSSFAEFSAWSSRKTSHISSGIGSSQPALSMICSFRVPNYRFLFGRSDGVSFATGLPWRVITISSPCSARSTSFVTCLTSSVMPTSIR
jgi:hypothetical protein